MIFGGRAAEGWEDLQTFGGLDNFKVTRLGEIVSRWKTPSKKMASYSRLGVIQFDQKAV